MKRFVEGVERSQSRLFPERLEDWIGADNPVRVIDVFVDELDLAGLGFCRVEQAHLPAYRQGLVAEVPGRRADTDWALPGYLLQDIGGAGWNFVAWKPLNGALQ